MDFLLWQPGQVLVSSNDSNYSAGHSWFDHCPGYGSGNDQHSYCIGDSSLFDVYYWYGQDVIEKDALNEKSCVQVLRIMIDRADEEIMELEEDIVMIQCQLAWNDEDWSKPCSVALRENIESLDNLILSLKIDNMKDGDCFDFQFDQPQKSPQRLHDLVKPLLENYLLTQTKQIQSRIAENMSVPSAAKLGEKDLVASTSMHDKKLEKTKCFSMLEHNDGKRLSLEPEDRKINIHLQRKDDMIKKCISDVQRCAYFMISNDMNNFFGFQRKKMTNSASGQLGSGSLNNLELSNTPSRDSGTSDSSGRCGSTERHNCEKTDREAITKEKTNEHRSRPESRVMNTHQESQETEINTTKKIKAADAQLDFKFSCAEQMTESSSEAQKARMLGHMNMIKPNKLFTEPLTKMKRSRTVLESKTTEMKENNVDSLIRLFNDTTKAKDKPKVLSGSVTQSQCAHEIKTQPNSQANSVSSLMCERQGSENICMAEPEIVDQVCKGPEKIEGVKNLRENIKKETQQAPSGAEVDGATDNTVTSIASSPKKKKLSVVSQNIRIKGVRDFLMELKKLDFDNPNTTYEEATITNCSTKDSSQNSVLGIKDVDRLSLNDLKLIAKSRKLPGYYKLRKAELQKQLGLQSQKASAKK